jgi:beta-galactosidase
VLRATSSGLTAATASVTSTAFTTTGGLTTRMPAGY